MVDEDDARTVYRTLSAMPLDEQRVVSRYLAPSMRYAVWSLNIAEYLQQHPELSVEQAALAKESLDYLTPEYFAAVPGTPVFEEGRRRRDLHKQRVESSLPREAIYGLFIRLGGMPEA